NLSSRGISKNIQTSFFEFFKELLMGAQSKLNLVRGSPFKNRIAFDHNARAFFPGGKIIRTQERLLSHANAAILMGFFCEFLSYGKGRRQSEAMKKIRGGAL